MAQPNQLPRMRSWLFAPGDSERKLVKAADSAADIVLLDLEDSVTNEAKPRARQQCAQLLASRSDRQRLWVRINPLDGQEALTDLAAIMPAGPGGIMLPKCEGRAHVERLDAYLAAFEQTHGLTLGSTRIAALITETPAALYSTGEYGGQFAGAARLAALSWGAEDLSSALGAQDQRGADGGYLPVYELARSLCLLGAARAGVAAIETVQPEFRDLDSLRQRAARCRRQGFTGMLAIHPAQIEPINAAFTPSGEEIERARAVVRAFAQNPGAGAVALDGAMLDRPHLKLAQRILAEAGEDAE